MHMFDCHAPRPASFIRWMIAGAFWALSLPSGAALAQQVTIGSDQPFMQGRHVAMNGPWSRWIDPTITNYSNAMRIQTTTWPNNTSLQWRFPDKVASTGVYGYNYVAYGQYWDLKPPVKVPPKKFSTIKTLKFYSSVDFSGDASRFNILAEFFVTRKPGDIKSRIAEVGWLLHMPAQSEKYFRSGKQLGTYRDAEGRGWDVASHRDGAAGHYIMLAPHSGNVVLTTPVDVMAAMRWLAARKEIGLDGYFNGMAVGVEPLRGAGNAVIRRFDIFYN